MSKSWEMEFDEEFGESFIKYLEPDLDFFSPDDVKDFIQDLLDRKAREIEGLRVVDKGEMIVKWGNGGESRFEIDSDKVVFFNQALDQAISILKEE